MDKAGGPVREHEGKQSGKQAGYGGTPTVSSKGKPLPGRLCIYLGYAPGSGKTYAMLDDAREQYLRGTDVVIGHIESPVPVETAKLVSGLPALAPQEIAQERLLLNEFDLDAALNRHPALIVIDQLAHSNTEGARNKKRYQDIEELLLAGIDVFTTLNVWHLESLSDSLGPLLQMDKMESVPDAVFDQADQIRLIDIEPEALLERMQGGLREVEREGADVAAAPGMHADHPLYTRESLQLLRELALRKAADRISHANQQESPTLPGQGLRAKWLVAISAAPSAAALIRWTAQAAAAFHAPWAAVHVETGQSDARSAAFKRAVRSHLELAERLGAQVVTLSGYEPAEVIAEYAELSGFSHIVIGKNPSRRIRFSFLETGFEERLIARLPTAQLHILPDSGASELYAPEPERRFTARLQLSWSDSLKTVGLLVLATLLSLLLNSFAITDHVIMLYILSVLIISRTTSGYVYGLAGSVLSVLAYNYLFTEPRYTFLAVQAGYPITFMIMLLVALITSALTVRIKTQAKLAVERERRTEVLYEINKKLLMTRGLEAIVDLTNEYLVRLFERSVIFYTEDPHGPAKHPGILRQSPVEPQADFLQSADERDVAHWVFVNQKQAGAGTDTHGQARALYVPVAVMGHVLGVLGVSSVSASGSKPLSQANRFFLRLLASQVAMALERQALSDEQRRIVIEAAQEKMRSNLLRAISHDLRTPLTGISGASSVILENRGTLDEETERRLLVDIREDALWLIRMVENLLSVTRIHDGTAHVVKSPEAVEEIVAEAIGRIRVRFPQAAIQVKVPDEFLLVPMDGTLIEQVLINLVENAIKHSRTDSPVEVEVSKGEDAVEFQVKDHGEGVPAEQLPHLFDSLAEGQMPSADSARGMGIGLSICMSIVRAHDGKMEAWNNPDGGAVFRFTLPLEA
jgi:two-component system sensor histidine kinase KdpD